MLFVVSKLVTFSVIMFGITVLCDPHIPYPRELEGYPRGLLSDCPGSTKAAKISNKSLRQLSFIKLGDGNFLVASKKSYNYFKMRALAKQLDFSKKTVVYMPGYLDSSHVFPVTPAMGAVYKKLGYNVLLLEYFYFSALPYHVASRILPAVGKRAAEMLSNLTSYGLKPSRLELIGISLGGQGISFIAKNYRLLTGFNISRVTSLDPSGPCFRHLDSEKRLDASDADFVDVIHTNIDGYGIANPVGHINFFVNGGEYQPSIFPLLPCTVLCSHIRVFTLWIAALQHPDSFIGRKCESVQAARDRNCLHEPMETNVMGLKTDRRKTGIFLLMTMNTFPFYLGKSGLTNEDVYMKELAKYNEDDVMVV